MSEHWTQRNLRLRKQFSAPIRFLLWVGFVRIVDSFPAPGTKPRIRWPFSTSPWHVVRYYLAVGPRVYVFRNLPGVIKWEPGRLLPHRWGFGICGFEFGDRGQ